MTYTMLDIHEIEQRLLQGGKLSEQEALQLDDIIDAHRDEIYTLAAALTQKFGSRRFDSCSIVNARSGRCPEDCKWCAQSAHYKTSADVYPLISRTDCLKAAELNRNHGIRRFSLVTSGRKMTGRDLATACEYIRDINAEGGLQLCASMGLLNSDELRQLLDAGIHRYHCNLESAPSHFATLCSTHSIEEKMATIRAAKALGMEICSGGIIGMGETRRQRIELGIKLWEADPVSIPINILCPIPGTPLEGQEAISEQDILDTVAIFRLMHPRVVIRFAGGRMALSRDAQRKAMHLGVNGSIMGDMLTTLGAQVADDKTLVAEAGYEF